METEITEEEARLRYNKALEDELQLIEHLKTKDNEKK